MRRTPANPKDLMRWNISTDQKLREMQYRAAHRANAELLVKCEWCGSKFRYNPKGNWKRFCKNKCRAAHTRYEARKTLLTIADACGTVG